MTSSSLEVLMARLRNEVLVGVETVATFLAPALTKADLEGPRAEGASIADEIELLFNDCNKFGRPTDRATR